MNKVRKWQLDVNKLSRQQARNKINFSKVHLRVVVNRKVVLLQDKYPHSMVRLTYSHFDFPDRVWIVYDLISLLARR